MIPPMMPFNELKEMVQRTIHNVPQTDVRYDANCKQVWDNLYSAHKAVLQQLLATGPVWDGDIASKTARDDLMELGLASRAVVRGEQGHTVANYVGWDIHKNRNYSNG